MMKSKDLDRTTVPKVRIGNGECTVGKERALLQLKVVQ